MAVHIIWSLLAKSDFKQAVTYIRDDNPIAAQQWRIALLERVELLADFPELGRLVPLKANPAAREIIFGRYRIIYQYAQITDSIQIIRIWHSARGEPEI